MSEIKARKLIEVPEFDTIMKIYFTGVDPPTGEEHFHSVIKSHPKYFEGKRGMGSIYGFHIEDDYVDGVTLRIYDILEDDPNNCMWRTFNFENGRHLPVGDAAACNREIKIFGDEADLMEKIGFNVPEWMKIFAYDIEA